MEIYTYYYNPILVYAFQFVTQGDQHAIELVEKYDWYFAPMLNPDGYVITWTTVYCIMVNEQSCREMFFGKDIISQLIDKCGVDFYNIQCRGCDHW